jgi:4-hydroxybenzoate polyprenyltransferase
MNVSFALQSKSSLALAWPKHPFTMRVFLWILVAMVAARTAAMGFNRLVDRKFDAANPRTRGWELPSGAVQVWEAALLTGVAALIFMLAAYQLNWLCFALSPVALGIVFFYSLTKRFTWASHLFLGLALAIAPIGAWLAVAEPPIDPTELVIPIYLGLAVVFWLAGFDIIYSLQDRDFDRASGLHSIPVKFGVEGALRLSTAFHCLTIFFLALVGLGAKMGVIYWIVTPTDLSRINRAFFDLNAYVSIGYLLTTIADMVVRAG